MKTLTTLAVAAALCAGSFQAQAQEQPSVKPDQVIARVGDEVITAGDFARDLQFKVRQIESATGQKVNPDARFRRALMGEMINSRILGIVARNSGTPVSDEELEKEFKERKSVFDSEEAYQGYLKRLNMTEESLKDSVRARLRVKNFVDQKTGVLTASDEEVTQAYDALKAQGKVNRTTDTRDIAVIMFRAKGGSDDAWRQAEERAKAARTRVEAGEDFQKLAREISEDPGTAPRGGVLREVKVGSFYPELESAMKDMKVGQASAPVRSVMGWYIITILAENKPGVVPLDSMRDVLREQVIDGKRRAKIAEIVEEAQKLIRVELMEAPEGAGAPPADLEKPPAQPLTLPAPASPARPVVPEAPAPDADTPPALPAPS